MAPLRAVYHNARGSISTGSPRSLDIFNDDPAAYVAKLKAKVISLDNEEIARFLKHKADVNQAVRHRAAAERPTTPPPSAG